MCEMIIKLVEIIFSGAVGVGITHYWAYKTREKTNYTYLDNLWVGMLDLYLTNPEYLNPEITKNYLNKLNEKEITSYNAFALTLQSTMETIYDVYGKKIPEEWKHIFEHHSYLHTSLLKNNPGGFRKEFIALVEQIRLSREGTSS